MGRSERREERRARVEDRFSHDSVDTVLDLLEVFELAWHDCYGDVSPSEDIVDDVLFLSGGDLAGLVGSVRLALTDWRDLKVAASEASNEAIDDVVFEVVDPESRDALASMRAYFAELDDRFPTGFDPGDTLVADAPGFRPPDGVFVVAYSGGVAVACGAVQRLDDGMAEIKRMWVDPGRRGQGLGKRLLADLEAHAVAIGNGVIRLDTNSVLTTAIAMYQAAGYVEIERYNDNPFARHWFEKQT